MVCPSAVDGNIEIPSGGTPQDVHVFNMAGPLEIKNEPISRTGFALFGDFVFHQPLRTKWQVRNRLDSGSPGGARGSVTRGDSTAYGGPCRPMLPPLGLVEAIPTDDWLGRAVCGSWSALPAP